MSAVSPRLCGMPMSIRDDGSLVNGEVIGYLHDY
jgi:hypothetical protein